MNISNFTIGADPEIFVRHKRQLVTAAGLVPGTKESAYKVPDGAYQVDGMALEFNVDPTPLTQLTEFNRKIVSVMKQLKNAVPDHSFVIKPSVQFDKDYYDNEVPESAKELGCDPDFNAYENGAQNPSPDGTSGLRSAAGHIHLGWTSGVPADHPDHVVICCRIVKQLDVYVGLTMLLIDNDSDRRKLYGKAGAFRPKSYGVEYRTPSNAWITSKERRLMIADLVQQAVLDMGKGYGVPMYQSIEDRDGPDYVRNIINEGRGADAINVLTRYGLIYTIPGRITRAAREMYNVGS